MLITEPSATQRWQNTACKVPIEDHGHVTIVVIWTLFGIATLAVTLRILARTLYLEKGYIGWDDWTSFITWAFLLPCSALVHIRELPYQILNTEPV